jgi:hypothetical protein
MSMSSQRLPEGEKRESLLGRAAPMPNLPRSSPSLRVLHIDFCLDLRCLIRLACSLVAPEAIVEQDLTEVVNAGYYDKDDAICANAVQELTSNCPANAKLIILAEGSTDTAILREALKGYFKFANCLLLIENSSSCR